MNRGVYRRLDTSFLLNVVSYIRRTMGRPWWYDSYWEKQKPPRKRLRLPRRSFWVWLAIVLISVLVTAVSGVSHLTLSGWTAKFVLYSCRILSLAVLVRALLSWFPVGGYNRLVVLLDDTTEPLLRPLRRMIPLIGRFDITPLVAIIVLNLIPPLVARILA